MKNISVKNRDAAMWGCQNAFSEKVRWGKNLNIRV